MLFLFKEEPSQYSFADLQRDGSTVWQGVTNNLALQHLRKVRVGDRILFYHTGKEKAIAGEMRALKDAGPDPAAENPKLAVVEVAAVRALPRRVPLSEIKNDPLLQDWELVRLPRLSVMPVTEAQWRRIEELSRQNP